MAIYEYFNIFYQNLCFGVYLESSRRDVCILKASKHIFLNQSIKILHKYSLFTESNKSL